MKLEDVKLEQLQNATTKRIYGSLVEGTPHLGVSTSAKWIAIRPCLCVWDSPDSPCHCLKSVLYWVLESDIRKSERLREKSEHEEEVLSFDLDIKARVGVEVLRVRPVASIPGDQREAMRKLAKAAAIIKKLKESRGACSPGTVGGMSMPGVSALSWDDLKEGLWDALEGLHGIFEAGENSGIDWETVLEIPWWIILL